MWTTRKHIKDTLP